jgi:hypothetical protein
MSRFVIIDIQAFIGFALNVACTVILAQGTGQQEELSRQVGELIQRLKSDIRATREDAESELFYLGRPAVDLLRAAAEKDSPDNARQLINLADRIERAEKTRRLRVLALGLVNFEDRYGTLPAAYSTDSDGKPLLSWRVSILPFIGEQSLFEEFHRNEPWDSAHNKTLISKMPDVYRARDGNAAPGRTNYLGVGGGHGVLGAPSPAAPRGRSANGIRSSSITDGRSNTALFVEGIDDAAVIWTKPEEWVPDEHDPFRGLIGPMRDGFLLVFADGFTQRISATVSAESLRRIFSRDDRKPIDLPREMP